MRGVQARPASWRELIVSDEHGGPLLPIMLLAHEHDPDPAKRPKPLDRQDSVDLPAAFSLGLTRSMMP